MSARIGKPERPVPSAGHAPVSNTPQRVSFAAALAEVASAAPTEAAEPLVPAIAQRIDEALAYLPLAEVDQEHVRELLADALAHDPELQGLQALARMARSP